MTPGPTLIMKAPGCKKPLKFNTIASGNTFGATFWTDGKMEAPMLPDEPLLMKSPSEGVLFWRKDCEEIGNSRNCEEKEKPQEWEKLEYAEAPEESDYFKALDNGVAQTGDQSKYLRMRLWWAGNDAIRRGIKECLSREHLDNLNAFVELLSSQEPDQRLMKVEVLRELGRFDEALQLLEFKYPDGYQRAVNLIRNLAQAHNPKLAEIQSPS